MKTMIGRFILITFCFFAGSACAFDRTDTGFFYPIGIKNFNSDGGTWLGRDSAHEKSEDAPPYFNGFYHIGVDMQSEEWSDVYAVADGIAMYISRDGKSWGSGNCALVVEHRTNRGKVFTAVYGHLRCDTLPSASSFRAYQVFAGKSVGKIGHWDYGDHLHFAVHDGSFNGLNPMAKSGWGRMPNSSWTDPCEGNDKCTNTFTDPVAFIKNHAPAHLIQKGEKTVSQTGKVYILDGSDWCQSAGHVYRIVDGGDENSAYWMTEEVDKSDACQAIVDADADVIQKVRDTGGTISTGQLIGEEKKTLWSAISSWFSSLTSLFHKLVADARISTALALEPSVQQQLVVHRKAQMYQIDGTDRQIVILTSGPGQNGDKAIDSVPYSGLETDGTFSPATDGNASGKRPDLVVTNIWTERSSGHEHDTIGFGDTVCLVADIKNAGNADTPSDVKVSFYVSKGNKEDKDPRHAGYEMAKAKYLTKARTAHAIVRRCINAREDDYPSPYPGTFNFGVHLDSDNRIAESNEKNNTKGGQIFTLIENARLIVSQFWISDTAGSVTAFATFTNAGTPFGSDKVNIQYRIQGPQYGPDPIILGFDQAKRGNLRTGDLKYEDLPFLAPTVPGSYILTVEIDYDHRVTEVDRGGNAQELTFTVLDPPE